jgi:hypothetical protein
VDAANQVAARAAVNPAADNPAVDDPAVGKAAVVNRAAAGRKAEAAALAAVISKRSLLQRIYGRASAELARCSLNQLDLCV